MTLLNTAHARFAAHIVVAFAAAFFTLFYAANFSLGRSVVYGTIAGAARALLGATTSTNPNVGKNVI